MNPLAPQTSESGGRLRKPTAERRQRKTDDMAQEASTDIPRPITPVREGGAERRRPQSRVVPRRRSEIANRAVNFLLALVALIILAPVMLLVAVAVWLTSRGPALYTQERVGIDRRARRTVAMYDRRGSNVGGRVFTIIKFRTMRVDAEQRSGAVWATQNDPRVTPIGRFLRGSRLDELPQLFNVLRGDMNIVGPRPERPSLFVSLRENIAEYPLRQLTKPGITGWAQINHSYDSCIDDVRTKVRYDLEYIQRQSLWEDVKIMLRTVPVMLFKKGGW